MLNMTLSQYEYAQNDYGRPTNVRLYEEDKATLFGGGDYDGVIQAFKRHSDGTFAYWFDISRGMAVTGLGAQVIGNVPITFPDLQVKESTVTSGGTGYVTPPNPVFELAPSGGRTAQGISFLTGDQVSRIEITDPGLYPAPMIPGITFTGGGGGSGATATAVMEKANAIGTFVWDKSNLPTIPGYLWLKAKLFKGGTGLDDATVVVSSDLVRVYVEFGVP
jgi:hypothetical protein